MEAHKYSFVSNKLFLCRKTIGVDLLLLALLITPFLNIVDVIWMFSPKNFNEWLNINTPISIKIIKDIIIVCFLLYLTNSFRKLSKTDLGIFSFFVIVLIFNTVQLFLLSLPTKATLNLFLAGTRWYLPLFFFPLLQNFQITNEEIVSFLKRYRIIIFLAVILQVAQLAFSTRWGECSADGCRASGFFAMPQPQAFFSLFFLFFSELFFLKRDKYFKALGYASIILTKSAAGIIGIAGFIFFKVTSKFKIITLALSLFVVIFFPIVTGRATYWRSPLTRLQLLLDMKFDNNYFGSYTNACSNISSITNELRLICQPPDSFLISLLGNLSPIIGIIFILIICYYVWKSRKYYLFIILGLFLAGGSYTEYFPICIFFPLLLGLKINNNDEIEKVKL